MPDDSPRVLVVTPPRAPSILTRFADHDDLEVVERFDLVDGATEEELIAGLEGVWAVVAGSEMYSRAVLSKAETLQAIIRFGVGFDAVDVQAATDNGVALFTTPGANAEAVADLALALMLACIRQLFTLDKAVRSGAWRPSEPSRDLAASTVAIVGLGAIGRAVARRLIGFGCRVLAVDPAPNREFCDQYGIEVVALDDALARCDVLTLHAPFSPQTDRLIGARELGLLRPDAIVINTSRGALIDQDALVSALADGQLAGAGLDVFEHEPLDPGDPLLSLSNVIVTGHVSSFTDLAIDRTCQAAERCIDTLLAGGTPEGFINPEAWSRVGSRP
jgi:D-3-phosphoglycerate dehydrogenase